MKNNIPDLAILPEIFTQFPDVLAVYLYGSHASGQTHAQSDLDLGIVPRDQQVRQQRLAILTELARHGFDQVDLAFLDTEDIVLKFEAVRRNRVVYQREEFDHPSYFSLILRQYFDFEPYLRTQRAAYKQRILDGKS
jgi:uncharacterized protein